MGCRTRRLQDKCTVTFSSAHPPPWATEMSTFGRRIRRYFTPCVGAPHIEKATSHTSPVGASRATTPFFFNVCWLKRIACLRPKSLLPAHYITVAEATRNSVAWPCRPAVSKAGPATTRRACSAQCGQRARLYRRYKHRSHSANDLSFQCMYNGTPLPRVTTPTC